MSTLHIQPLSGRDPLQGGRWRLVGVLTALVVMICGCAEKMHSVSGQVSLDGAPVVDGSISFAPTDGKGPSFGGAIVSGSYAVAAPTHGRKVVRVSAIRTTGRKVPEDPLIPNSPLVDETEPYIPIEFNDQSTLTCDVVAGPNSFDFNLKSP